MDRTFPLLVILTALTMFTQGCDQYKIRELRPIDSTVDFGPIKGNRIVAPFAEEHFGRESNDNVLMQIPFSTSEDVQIVHHEIHTTGTEAVPVVQQIEKLGATSYLLHLDKSIEIQQWFTFIFRGVTTASNEPIRFHFYIAWLPNDYSQDGRVNCTRPPLIYDEETDNYTAEDPAAADDWLAVVNIVYDHMNTEYEYGSPLRLFDFNQDGMLTSIDLHPSFFLGTCNGTRGDSRAWNGAELPELPTLPY